MIRFSGDGDQALVVVHTFADPLPTEMDISLPHGRWQISSAFPKITASVEVVANQLRIKVTSEFEGLVLWLIRN